MVIWKKVLPITDVSALDLPMGAKILSVANQRGDVCLWYLCDPHQPVERRIIRIIGTGNRISDADTLTFIGTVVVEPFVWHVFEAG